MKIITKSLNSELWDDFEKYFEYQGKCSGCWCMNHRLPIGLDFDGEAAKLAVKQLVETNRVNGILAYSENDEIPIGWLSLDKRKTLPGHDCIGEDIKCSKNEWSIHCITTRSDYKNKGIEKIMIESALKLAKDLGANKVESYPEPNSKEGQKFRTWNNFNSTEETFVNLKFKKIDKDYQEEAEFYRPMERNI